MSHPVTFGVTPQEGNYILQFLNQISNFKLKLQILDTMSQLEQKF
jgi:hypothetical protein